MKKIKCLAVFVMLVVIAVCSAYSQNANGAELLQKGKDYEAKKEYVYALGCYYDAIEAGGESTDDAMAAFDTLATYIREGNPGPGKYNEFTLHDGWLTLLQNAEKYWTENCPWIFYFGIGNKTVDYATRTASYDLEIYCDYEHRKGDYGGRITNNNPKYNKIVEDIIYSGLKVAWKNDWTDIPWEKDRQYESWPCISVYKNSPGKYMQNGSALFDWHPDMKRPYNPSCAWYIYGFFTEGYEGYRGSDYFLTYSLYDMKVAICDVSGKELLRSNRILVQWKGTKYTFSGVTPDIMDVIDNEPVTVKITDLYLEYGKLNSDRRGRAFIKNLPELKLDVDSLYKPTEIRDGAFSNSGAKWNNNDMKCIIIPASVTRIGDWAFHTCVSLTNVTIPNSVTEIGRGAFYGCSSLTSVTIPDSVTSIGDYVFSSCSSLASVTILDSVTSIGKESFLGCSSLTSVTIPDSVTTIGESAFGGCTSLTSVTIPDGVTTIGGSAFRGCTSLTSVTIPDGVTTIGDYVFSSCSSLTSVTIPDSVTEIGRGAFYGCSSLTSVTIPNSVTSMECDSFDDYVTVTYKGTTDTWQNIYNKFFRK